MEERAKPGHGPTLGQAWWAPLGRPEMPDPQPLFPTRTLGNSYRITHEAAQGETGKYTQPSPSSHSTENRKPRKEAAAMVWLWDT